MNNNFNQTDDNEFSLYDEVVLEKNKRNYRRDIGQKKKALRDEREMMDYEW